MKKGKKLLETEHKMYKVSFNKPKTGVDYHWSYDNESTKHEHDFYEFVIITDGKMRHFHNSNNYIISKGTFFLIKPKEYHQFVSIDDIPAKQICFSITPETLEKITATLWQNDVMNLLNQNIPSSILPKKIYTNVFNIVDRINQCPPNSQTIYVLIKTIIIELLSYLIDNLETNDNLTNKKNPPEWLTNFLKKLNDPEIFTMKLKDIYPLAPYSQSMLNVYFNEYVGMTLITYITKLKMSYACNLLQYTDDSPLDISCKLNYDSLSHFNRIFKKFTGRSPITYKKSIKKS